MLTLLVGLFILAAAILTLLLRNLSRQRQTLAEAEERLQRAAAAVQDCERRHEATFHANPYPMWVYDCETLRLSRLMRRRSAPMATRAKSSST